METRTCSHCNTTIIKGYVVFGGEEYYCTDKCLNKHYSREEWELLYDNGESDSYWTEWN